MKKMSKAFCVAAAALLLVSCGQQGKNQAASGAVSSQTASSAAQSPVSGAAESDAEEANTVLFPEAFLGIDVPERWSAFKTYLLPKGEDTAFVIITGAPAQEAELSAVPDALAESMHERALERASTMDGEFTEEAEENVTVAGNSMVRVSGILETTYGPNNMPSEQYKYCGYYFAMDKNGVAANGVPASVFVFLCTKNYEDSSYADPGEDVWTSYQQELEAMVTTIQAY